MYGPNAAFQNNFDIQVYVYYVEIRPKVFDKQFRTRQDLLLYEDWVMGFRRSVSGDG